MTDHPSDVRTAEKLAQAATEARYLFQVYCQFQKPIPQSMLVKCCADLVEGLEEYHAATGENSLPVAKLREGEKFDAGLGSYLTLGEEFSQ